MKHYYDSYEDKIIEEYGGFGAYEFANVFWREFHILLSPEDVQIIRLFDLMLEQELRRSVGEGDAKG